MVVLSLATARNEEWKGVADALAVKHADAQVAELTVEPSVTNALEGIRAKQPRYVAFVMRPEEVDFATTVALKRMMREIDADPFEDAIWGIVTGPTAADAKRIASSSEPRTVRTALATTGVGDDVVPGPLYCISDAYPEGCWRVKAADGSVAQHSSSNDISHVFAEGWNTLDPDLVLTSSHASQRNLEMPFSRGNIVPRGGAFRTLPNDILIDYTTGQARSDSVRRAAGSVLNAPVREKVWIAAGNCLIADNLRPGDNMVMTALGFGKVNQFVGYIATTWFGEIGWGTWRYFGAYRLPLNESYYAANQNLLRRLSETVANASAFKPVFVSAEDYDRMMAEVRRFRFEGKVPLAERQQFVGRLWDRDATVFYGDPLQRTALAPRKGPIPASDKDSAPLPIVFPEAKPGRRLVSAPEGFEVFVADDFALVTKWPELTEGWREKLVFD